MATTKLDAWRLALAGGILTGAMTALSTVLSMLGVPGYPAFTSMLVSLYGFYGYSVTAQGVFIGAFWGFLEGAIYIGLLGSIYNALVQRL